MLWSELYSISQPVCAVPVEMTCRHMNMTFVAPSTIWFTGASASGVDVLSTVEICTQSDHGLSSCHFVDACTRH